MSKLQVQELKLKKRQGGEEVCMQLCTRCQKGAYVKVLYEILEVMRYRLRDGGCELCGKSPATWERQH